MKLTQQAHGGGTRRRTWSNCIATKLLNDNVTSDDFWTTHGAMLPALSSVIPEYTVRKD